MLYLILYVALT